MTAAGEEDALRESRSEPGTERILAFSDGVFAIAITLLVLNIGIDPQTRRLPEELLSLWPAYLAYGMSFIIIGIIWAQHHAIFSLINRTDHVFLLINIIFLMWIAFLPFPAHVLGQELGKHNQQTAMSFYAGTFLLGTLPFNLLWRYPASGYRLLRPDADPHLVRVTTRSYTIGPFLYLLDFLLSFVNVPLSVALFALLPLFYAIAPIPAVARARIMRPLTGAPAPDGD